MSKKTIKTILTTTLLCGFLSLGVFTSKIQNLTINPVFAYENNDAATYYNGISSTSTGTDLINELNTLNKTKLKSRVGYSNMADKVKNGKVVTYGKFIYTDYDPAKGYGSTTLLSFYSGKSAEYNGNMNREHTWPASRTVGGRNNDPLEDDIHMTRPTLTSENSSRGNSFFAEKGAWDPASFNNPSYRGDAARIIMYCVIADPRLKLVDKTDEDAGYHSMGKLSDLLKWNLEYPVQQREKNRNEGAEGLQGNRNPFIDHPEYGCRIWGNTNDKTREICKNSLPDTPVTPDTPDTPDVPDTPDTPDTPVEPEKLSVKLSSEEMTLAYNSSATLSATITPEGITTDPLVWISKNTAVATVEDGVITAVGPGTTEIEVHVTTADESCFASCKVTVTGGPSTGCGGSIIASSVIISTTSLLGFSFLIIKKRKEE